MYLTRDLLVPFDLHLQFLDLPDDLRAEVDAGIMARFMPPVRMDAHRRVSLVIAD